MKRVILVLLAVFFSGMIHAESCSGLMPVMGGDNASEKATYFFFQHAPSAAIQAKPEGHAYTITFTNIAPQVFYVSDRPNRIAGSFEVSKFLKLWSCIGNNSFQATPPNAIIHGSVMQAGASAQSFNLSAELTEPKYDSHTNTLSYTATVLKGSSPIRTDLTLEQVSVFIDDVCLKCWKP